MDEHFRTAPLDQNLPVVLALLGVWYRNFLGAATLRSCPTTSTCARFAAYLQQGDMESNGKCVRRDGTRSTTRPGRSSGASRAPTASTRSIS